MKKNSILAFVATVIFVLSASAYESSVEIDHELDLKFRLIAAERSILLEQKNALEIRLREEIDNDPQIFSDLVEVSRKLELLASNRLTLASDSPTVHPPSLEVILESLKKATDSIPFGAVSDERLFSLIELAQKAVVQKQPGSN